MLAAIPSLSRAGLAQLTMRMIDRMDEIDGDPDFELHGDERDGSMGEDDFHMQNQNWMLHPGCPLADPSEDSHDFEQDDTYE
ncbi:hypothetical protein ASE75_13810 [Sphingomonas sp. Leaf17]|uniref:hypothetical protein n=1 Tax=Sphingomonas sp. Leaf17 TaxID=1735683 RepID=UPI0006FBA09A|nr:hypothetical protein [Sphingomonas sp. Leaf17]KQM62699.1 hypothetical protein ASE75_13810 [Sphingomonas sp. Leaf17]